jgi:hypothetical protein
LEDIVLPETIMLEGMPSKRVKRGWLLELLGWRFWLEEVPLLPLALRLLRLCMNWEKYWCIWSWLGIVTKLWCPQ